MIQSINQRINVRNKITITDFERKIDNGIQNRTFLNQYSDPIQNSDHPVSGLLSTI